MEDQILRISLVQADLEWENPKANLNQFTQLISKLGGTTDLVLLPETFTTGFSMLTERFAEEAGGETLEWMATQAARLKAVVAGTLIFREGQACFNRLFWMKPDGTYLSYDKRHLFRMSDEDQYFKKGTQRVSFHLNGWRIRPIICYDLRFPVWARNTNDYDLLINLANWPASRREVWLTLLRARALENLAYVAGVNRTGTDGHGTAFSGDSAMFDFMGKELTRLGEGQTAVETISLSLGALQEFRQKFPAWMDADPFEIPGEG